MSQRIVLATGNKGKVHEMAELLAEFGFEVLPQSQFGVPDVRNRSYLCRERHHQGTQRGTSHRPAGHCRRFGT